jgi:hypothetical protein
MISFIAFFAVFFFGTILEVFCGVTFYERVRVAVDWLFVGKGHVSFPDEKRHWPFLFLFLCTFLASVPNFLASFSVSKSLISYSVSYLKMLSPVPWQSLLWLSWHCLQKVV